MHKYYETLGLKNNATPDEIKKAYIAKACEIFSDNEIIDKEEEFHQLKLAFLNLTIPGLNSLEDDSVTIADHSPRARTALTSPRLKTSFRKTTTMPGEIPIKINFLGIRGDGRQELINALNPAPERITTVNDAVPYQFKYESLSYKLLLCDSVSAEGLYLINAFALLKGAQVAVITLDMDDTSRFNAGLKILTTLFEQREKYPNLQIQILGITAKLNEESSTPEHIIKMMQENPDLLKFDYCDTNDVEIFRRIIQSCATSAYNNLSSQAFLKLNTNPPGASTSTSATPVSSGLFASLKSLLFGSTIPAAPSSAPAASTAPTAEARAPSSAPAAAISRSLFHS